MKLFMQQHHLDADVKDANVVREMLHDPVTMINKKVLIAGQLVDVEHVTVRGKMATAYHISINVPGTWPVQTTQIIFWPNAPTLPSLVFCVGRIMGSTSVRTVPSGINRSVPSVSEIECLDRPEVRDRLTRQALILQSSKHP
ncbi:MAG: hypothetical protein Q7U76_13025 [Nitrospirota bacterium]|nr:hypothetical protein [Nitrospirota bacterium]